MGHQAFPLAFWNKGVNLIDPPGELEPSELTECENYRLDVKGFPFKRPGYTGYGSAPANVNGNNYIQFLFRLYKSDFSKVLVSGANGKIFTINDSTGASTQINVDGASGTNMNTSNLFSGMVYKDRLYICDGTKPVRFNGTDAPYAGFFLAPAPGGAASGGGVLSAGTYKYAVANVAGNMGEGPLGTAFTIGPVSANDKVDLTGIVDAPSRYEQTAKRIYRTKANQTTFYLLAEIANGVTTYSDATVADSALTNQYIPVHNPRTDARFAILGYDERTYWCVFAAGFGSIVEVSDIGFPDRILDNEFFTVSNNDSDLVTGAARSPSGLVFFKRGSMWLKRSFNSELVNISPQVGCIAPWSIVQVPGGLIFLSNRGEIYFYDGVNLTEIGRSVKPEFVEMTAAALDRVVATYHDFRYIISYDPRGDQGFNYKTLEYELIGGKWDGPHLNELTFTPGYYCAFEAKLDRNELTWGNSRASTGSLIFVRRENQYLDNARKFLSAFRTGTNWMESVGPILLSRIELQGRFTGDSVISASFVLDDENTEITCTPIKNVPGTVPLFGSAHFGVDAFSTIDLVVGEDTLDITARANKPSLRIRDDGSSTYHRIERLIAWGTALPRS
jgi:hypothetical protein